MSEYQYYEFQAIDRALTADEISALRAVSTRARITARSFVNHYNWGDLKANPDDWMDRYFDAFLYVANWGTRELQLRFPERLLDLDTALAYSGDASFTARQSGDKVVLAFASEDEPDDDWFEAEDFLPSLIGVRAELARGDRRALYLGWLLCVQAEQLDDDVEPEVPAGLDDLGASLQALAEFLRLDADLLHVAAQASAPPDAAMPGQDEVLAWLGRLPATEKDAVLARLFTEAAPTVPAELRQRFLRDRQPAGQAAGTARRRTVGELIAAADARMQERHRLEAEQAAIERERQQSEAAAARAKHLDALAGQDGRLWREVESLVATRQPQRYNDAVRLLLDLRDLATPQGGDFAARLAELRARHAKKKTLVDRLVRAGL